MDNGLITVDSPTEAVREKDLEAEAPHVDAMNVNFIMYENEKKYSRMGGL